MPCLDFSNFTIFKSSIPCVAQLEKAVRIPSNLRSGKGLNRSQPRILLLVLFLLPCCTVIQQLFLAGYTAYTDTRTHTHGAVYLYLLRPLLHLSTFTLTLALTLISIFGFTSTHIIYDIVFHSKILVLTLQY